MLLTRKKGNKNFKLIIFSSSLLVFLVLIINFTPLGYSKSNSIALENLNQKIMSLDLGFSSNRNLFDDGINSINESLSSRVSNLIKKLPQIINYKFFDDQKFQFPHIYIDINLKNYLKIIENQKNALHLGLLVDPEEINAKIRFENKTYKAKLRLKGDLEDHWKSNLRMSLRINLRDNNTILGFNKFSIQKPRSRQFPYDFIYQEISSKSGNISTKNHFAKISVNGEEWGVMNIEEHVSKELLEKQNKKDSIIIKFSDERNWLYEKMLTDKYLPYKISDSSFNINLYDQKRLLKDNHNRLLLSYIAKEKLRNNLNIYDEDSILKAALLAGIWGQNHVLLNSNAKYYLNPYTLKLEIITGDQTNWKSIEELDYAGVPRHFVSILQNNQNTKKLEENLEIVLDSLSNLDVYLLNAKTIFPVDMVKQGKTILRNLEVLSSSNSLVLFEKLNHHSENNIEEIETKILPTFTQSSEFKDHVYIQHYLNGDLAIFNLLPDEVTLNKIFFDDELFTDKKIIIPGYNIKSEPTRIKTPFLGIQDGMFSVESEYKGFKKKSSTGLSLFFNSLINPLDQDTSNNFTFINKLDDTSYEIVKGDWTVNEPIIISGDLIINPGTRLSFLNDSYLVVKGSLRASGSKTEPIIFQANEDLWKGVFVLNSNNMSVIENAEFSNMSGLDDNLLKLTGGINFYRANTILNNVQIKNNNSEDAINIVDSNFKLNNITITNSISDGFDSDFSTGEVTNSYFFNIGGDALDFSGSKVLIDNVLVENVRDKAVSAGEESDLTINSSRFKNIFIGIASKDASNVEVLNTDIDNFHLHAAMTYQKKNFYEMPSMTIKNCNISSGNAFLRQKNSFLSVDNVSISETAFSLDELDIY